MFLHHTLKHCFSLIFTMWVCNRSSVLNRNHNFIYNMTILKQYFLVSTVINVPYKTKPAKKYRYNRFQFASVDSLIKVTSALSTRAIELVMGRACLDGIKLYMLLKQTARNDRLYMGGFSVSSDEDITRDKRLLTS